MLSRRTLTAAAATALFGASILLPGATFAQGPAAAPLDRTGRSVLEWTDVALHAAIDGAKQDGAATMETVGIVQAAVHDAVASITGDLRPFSATDASWPGARTDLAIGAAAHAVLVRLFPDQEPALDDAWGQFVNDHASLIAIEYDRDTQHGIQAGEDAARRVVATLGR